MQRMSDNVDLVSYREAVEALMRLQSGEVIANSIPLHAAIIFEVFFKHAKDHVRIFCKNLNNQVFGKDFVVNSAREAVLRGVQIWILIQDSQPQDGPFMNLIEEIKQKEGT